MNLQKSSAPTLSGIRSRLDATLAGTVATGLAGQAALVVSGVLVARALGPHDRGQLALFVVISTVSCFVLAAGLPTALLYSVAGRPSAARPALGAIRRIVIAQAALSIVVPAAILFVVASSQGQSTLRAAMFTVPTTLAALVMMYSLALLQGQSKFGLFNRARLLVPGFYASLVVALYVAGVRSLEAFAVAFTAGNCIAAVLMIAVIAKSLPADDGAEVDGREMVRYGLKAQVGVASPLENFQLDQIVVGAMVGPAGLGIYVVGVAFTNLPRFLAQSLGMVVFPRVTQRMKTGGVRREVAEALITAAGLMGAVVLVLEVTMGWLVPFFFGEAFIESIPVARLMLIGAFFLGMRRVLGDALRGANLPLPGTTAELVSWLSFLILFFPLVSAYDAVGAAIAVTCSAAASFAVLAWSASRAVRAN